MITVGPAPQLPKREFAQGSVEWTQQQRDQHKPERSDLEPAVGSVEHAAAQKRETTP